MCNGVIWKMEPDLHMQSGGTTGNGHKLQQGEFQLGKKKIKISEWVNSERGCLEVVKSSSLKRLKAQMENAEQF